MRKGQTLSITAKLERARAMSRAAASRELLYAGVLARLWPAYITPIPDNDDYPACLCVESPAGLLTWRLAADERDMPYFAWLERRKTDLKRATDRTPLLLALAENHWR